MYIACVIPSPFPPSGQPITGSDIHIEGARSKSLATRFLMKRKSGVAGRCGEGRSQPFAVYFPYGLLQGCRKVQVIQLYGEVLNLAP
jgi:hypothetical protein